MKKYAVIVAGGSGVRMKSVVPKQFLLLRGKPVLWHSINAFIEAFTDIHIIVVLPAAHMASGETIIQDLQSQHPIQLLAGDETRFGSVKNGLGVIREECVVFVHDAVRCLATAALIQACYQMAVEKGNAVPAIAATDSMRLSTEMGNTSLNRDEVRIIQTPQTFLSSVILPAFEQPYNPSFTDEATVVEQSGGTIHLIPGETNNIKITRPIDLIIADQLLEERTRIVQ